MATEMHLHTGGPPAPAARPDAMVPVPHRVVDKSRETQDTVTLSLEPVAETLPSFEPGQFAMVYAFGVGEVPISLSRDPLVHTVREVGAVTRAICACEPGDVLGLRGPFGTAWPLDAAAGRDVVVVAGGIGLPPLRPAIHRLLAERERYGALTLLYGARLPSERIFPEEQARWREQGMVVEQIVDRPESGWEGPVGVVTKLIERAAFDAAAATAFVVGPEIMMRFVALALLDRGVASEQVHLSMERSMECGVGHCGHCQLGPLLICRDGPVLPYPALAKWMAVRNL